MVSEFMPRRLPPGLEILTELALDLRWTFTALASRDRPASSYTPRILPAATSTSIPLELPLIAWQR